MDNDDIRAERVAQYGRMLGSRWIVAGAVAFVGMPGGALLETYCEMGWDWFFKPGNAYLPDAIQICDQFSVMCARWGQTSHAGGKGDRVL